MLCKVDRMTMAASLEARSPLLDVALLEYVASLPLRRRLPRWNRRALKKLLREAVAPLVPPALLNRPKHGFDVPLDDWMRGGAAGLVADVLSPERVGRRGLFNAAYIERVKAEHAAGRTRAGNRLYALVVFELWAEEYLQ
jgi:asparagine synthase (glutamine-hydrolysing)